MERNITKKILPGGLVEANNRVNRDWLAVPSQMELFDDIYHEETNLPINTCARLLKLMCEYFDHVDQMYYVKEDFIKGGDDAGRIVSLRQSRPYTISGFQLFLQTRGYHTSIRSYLDGRYPQYEAARLFFESVINDCWLAGAAAGMFNAGIASKYLGLTEKVEVGSKVSADDIPYEELSTEALEEIAAAKKRITDRKLLN